MIKRKISKINQIHIHHSASNNPKHDDVSVIDHWHKERGWEMVGYTFFIRAVNGEVQLGRPIQYAPASVKGHNKRAIAICLSGNFAFTGKQLISLYRLLEFLIQKYGINPDKIYRHCDLDKSSVCPGFELSSAFVEEMKRKV